MANSTEEYVVSYFAEYFRIDKDQVLKGSSLSDLGAESTDQPELTLELEEHFDTDLPDDIVDLGQTVEMIIDQINQALNKAGNVT